MNIYIYFFRGGWEEGGGRNFEGTDDRAVMYILFGGWGGGKSLQTNSLLKSLDLDITLEVNTSWSS